MPPRNHTPRMVGDFGQLSPEVPLVIIPNHSESVESTFYHTLQQIATRQF